MSTHDAIVIGAGRNGLTAALCLDRAGCQTPVPEHNARIGGEEAYADRVIAGLDRYAPGIRDLILARAAHSPEGLGRDIPSFGGDSAAGCRHLRPSPGASTYAMPLGGLYLVGAATWPGRG